MELIVLSVVGTTALLATQLYELVYVCPPRELPITKLPVAGPPVGLPAPVRGAQRTG